jgi:hypothetical protein
MQKSFAAAAIAISSARAIDLAQPQHSARPFETLVNFNSLFTF